MTTRPPKTPAPRSSNEPEIAGGTQSVLTLEAISQWLDTQVEGAPSASMIDGFLTALAIGPLVIPAEIWLHSILAELLDKHQDSKVEAATQALVHRYAEIIRQLAWYPQSYQPILNSDREDDELLDSWANGFFDAMQFDFSAWLPFFTNPASAQALAVILSHSKDIAEEMEIEPSHTREFGGQQFATWQVLALLVASLRRACATARSNDATD